MLRALLQATRPLAHANVAPPILYGQALAYAMTGAFSWRALALAQIFGLVDHLFIVFANDFADREADARNDGFNAFSGGSRVLPEGRLAPRVILGLAIACSIVLVAGTIPFALERPLLPVLACAAIALMVMYSYPPLALSYRGGGEWLQAIGVGLVLPLVGFHAQEPSLRAIPWLALVPTIVLGLAGNVLTALPDEPADRATSKRTWAVRRGVPRAARDLVALVALAIVLGGIVLPFPTHLARVVATALPLGVLGASLPLLPREVMRRSELLVFMIVAGAASTGALVAWTIALACG
ncbi:prenyltransferase [Sandaracinus amylolyticus]|uniref:1,4-dihydroxy-2-naphthoate polyprenyltransferase n=1 Tax=Sandaracinus amylolyticus TaxID=927083 RepID=A0A0F6YL75_9BACT|nr:prenyltransferase [Sandaracinus amylolyticus]AKF08003.1 1,4-dihydroxy-2-naphthoate polyprenyltransferase [Sandaracinus amylolyticus]